ncbi:MAG: GTPase HflX [Deltaproteobacteria bacterium]|nr:GTPase HflX [Deltaproteobacteria bacterium]
MYQRKFVPERTYVLGIHTFKMTRSEAHESVEETMNLVYTAGADLVGSEFVEIRQFNPSTFIGQGKVEEVKNRLKELNVELAIVDHQLSPIQNRNLEEAWGVRVIDRTGLILDIFAQRAQSKEGKLQVELAQYQYLLPRLVGAWTHFSKQRGGSIGLRGAGETQLEVDRRRVRERINMLRKNLKKVACSREVHRNKRNSVPIPTLSLIGYTNAGKSTLFNQLTGSDDVIVEDKLFATLDPKTKKIRLASGQKVLVSDTVGFIRNLPLELIESFKSTFQEVANADVLLHIIDASHPDRAQQIKTVENLLVDLGLHHKPVINVLNKIDRLETELPEGCVLSNAVNGAVKISALKGFGIETLLTQVEEKLSLCYYRRLRLLVPHSLGKVLHDLYTHGCVISSKNTAHGSEIEVDLPPKWQNKYEEFVVAAPLGARV